MYLCTHSISENIKLIHSTQLQHVANIEELENKKISKLLWQYALPAIVGTLVNSLYNVIDRVFIGLWVGDDALLVMKKTKFMPLYDKIMLRKRSVIETINEQLKNICDIEHTRHRSVHNFFVNLIAALGAYSFFGKKPSIKMQTKTDSCQLDLFF